MTRTHEESRHVRHEPEEAKHRIAAVAAELFAERGFGGTSMQTIADAAQVNKAMLYYYYASKRDLYLSIIRSGMEMMNDLLDEVAGGPGPASARIGEFARRCYLLRSTNPALGRIIERELMGLGEGVTPALGEQVLAGMTKLASLIRDGIDGKEFRRVDPTLAARSLLGMLNVFSKESVLPGDNYPPQRVIDHMVELFCRGMAR
jgi:AcrR family transcriptional regulator